MEIEKLMSFIRIKGYSTQNDIDKHFNENREIVSTHIGYLLSKHKIKKIIYQESYDTKETLFYIPVM